MFTFLTHKSISSSKDVLHVTSQMVSLHCEDVHMTTLMVDRRDEAPGAPRASGTPVDRRHVSRMIHLLIGHTYLSSNPIGLIA